MTLAPPDFPLPFEAIDLFHNSEVFFKIIYWLVTLSGVEGYVLAHPKSFDSAQDDYAKNEH